jgi:DNA-binding beta-propeller fold protein YncE
MRVATAGAIGDAVAVYNADGARQWQTTVPGRPVRVAFSPDGATIAAALSADGAVALLDRHGRSRRVAVGGLPDGLLFDPSSEVLYVSDLDAGRVTAVNVRSGRVQAVYEAPGGMIASSGALLAVAHQRVFGGLACPIVRQ